MEGTVDRIEVSQVLAPRGVHAVFDPITASEEVPPPRIFETPSAPRPGARSRRRFDQIPSVVRARLVGYDEV